MFIINGKKRREVNKDDLSYLYLATYNDSERIHANEIFRIIIQVNNDTDVLYDTIGLIFNILQDNFNTIRERYELNVVDIDIEKADQVTVFYDRMIETLKEQQRRDHVFRLVYKFIKNYIDNLSGYSI